MASLNPLRLGVLSEAGVRTDRKLLFDGEGKMSASQTEDNLVREASTRLVSVRG